MKNKMGDISKCRGLNCPYKYECSRFLIVGSSNFQSWSNFDGIREDDCQFFYKVDKKITLEEAKNKAKKEQLESKKHMIKQMESKQDIYLFIQKKVLPRDRWQIVEYYPNFEKRIAWGDFISSLQAVRAFSEYLFNDREYLEKRSAQWERF